MNIIIKIFIFLCIFIFIWDLLTRKYINPYKLYMLVGKKGCGKTTYLTKKAIQYLDKGFKVYSSFSIPGCELFNPKEIGKYTFERNSVVIVDEIAILFHSRNFKTFPECVRVYFKLQRQYKNIVIIASQSWDVDKSIRDLVDEIRLMKNFARVFTYSRRVDKRLTVRTITDESGHQEGGLIEDYILSGLLLPGSIDFTFIPRWVPFFETDYAIKENNLDIISSEHINMNNLQRRVVKYKGYVLYKISKFFRELPINCKRLLFSFKNIFSHKQNYIQ